MGNVETVQRDHTNLLEEILRRLPEGA